MYQSLHCIALHAIKYNDKYSILKAYSLERGTLSFLVPAGKGKGAMRMRALVWPLSLFECEGRIDPGKEICSIKEIRISYPLPNLRLNPIKNVIAVFLADLLNAVLRETPSDKALFLFVSDAVRRLDSIRKGVANFHICFLYQLAHYIGIAPDISAFREGSVFDMIDGTFRQSAPLHKKYLDQDQAKVVADLSRMTFDNMHLFSLNHRQRIELLDGIMDYYTIHYSSLTNLRSVQVLHALFQ